MTIREEINTAYESYANKELDGGRIPDPLIFGANWMAERCAEETRKRISMRHSPMTAEEIENLAKGLTHEER